MDHVLHKHMKLEMKEPLTLESIAARLSGVIACVWLLFYLNTYVAHDKTTTTPIV